MHALAMWLGWPGVPTDQARLVESPFSHVKGEWLRLTAITDPTDLFAELEQVRIEDDTILLHPGIGSVTPNDGHEGVDRRPRRYTPDRRREGPLLRSAALHT
ncbi:MAG TPA: hypothetical protein ENK55_12435, partial [Actinobacteria bacterium]|nr:hypothetical protein [Actinomycetota bacterium]